ncbi:ATPase, T2SS/T4P/T4SS family [Paraburkholderia humisilvae]|uniref:Type IV secretion system protein VirB11 n=1 Tax=Paraburkholderia humisilvae TaxID=627669 RepID=A0A6J5F152_9BURK|nr:ATPase, T2SS/T4P/T4SS family [Paraburkholderia humisilvae]CAB3772084.1 Type IV secretion system protein VirB11 [Paraburkholderia humisilvae]
MQYDDSVTVRSHLKTLGVAECLSCPGVTEFAINRPYEGWTETRDGWQRHELPNASLDALNQFAPALAIYNKAKPALSAAEPEKPVRLPGGERGQILIPPACEPGTVSLTIRVPGSTRFKIPELIQGGFLNGFRDVTDRDVDLVRDRFESGIVDVRSATPVFNPSRELASPAIVALLPFELEMLDALAQRDVERFLTLAILNRLNIVLVGGTGSGKTTLTKALADLVPEHTRVATIEDTHELPLPYHPNHVHLFYSESLPARRIVKATLRMKFDRVLLAELRGDETWDYLTLLNTGHQGGITTVHANDAIAALARIATLVKQSPVGQTLTWDHLMREVKTTIDVVLYMENRQLKEIYFDPVTKWNLLRGLA